MQALAADGQTSAIAFHSACDTRRQLANQGTRFVLVESRLPEMVV